MKSSRSRRLGCSPEAVAAAALVVAAAAAFALPAAAAGADAVPGQLIAGLRAGIAPARAQALVEHAGGRVAARLGGIGADVVRPRGVLTLSGLRTRLQRLGAVRFAEPDYYLHQNATPDDPLYA